MPRSPAARKASRRLFPAGAAPDVERYHLAYEAATVLSLATDTASLLKEAGNLFGRLYPDDRVWCFHVMDRTDLQVQRFCVSHGDDPPEGAFPASRLGVLGQVLKTGEPVLLNDVRKDPRYVGITQEEMRSELAVPLRAGGAILGAINLESPKVGRYTRDDVRIVMGIGLQLASALAHLEDRRRLEKSLLATISTLSAMVEGKDDYTEGHCQRIAEMAVEVAIRLGMGGPALQDVTHAGLLHDIGKVAIPDAILLKPGSLSRDETEIMRTHTTIGRRLLSGVEGLERVALIVEQHHEHFDGRGYPRGLGGEDILPEARIISVVDAFDAMTSTRPYRRAMDRETARGLLRAGAGGQFDPEVVEVFLGV